MLLAIKVSKVAERSTVATADPAPVVCNVAASTRAFGARTVAANSRPAKMGSCFTIA